MGNEARNKYMREYARSNKEKIKAQRRKRVEGLSEDELERRRELGRLRNRRYHAAHRKEINARAKSKNWNYNPALAKTKRQAYYAKYPARSILATVKARAAKKGIIYDLTEDWYHQELAKGCAVTKVNFAPARSGSPWIPHVDKIKPEEGYTKGNCRLVCAMYNQAKGKWADADVYDMAFCIVNDEL